MVSAIIVAGGKGTRMGKSINKQYIKLCGKEIIAITLDRFEKCKEIDNIILVVPHDDIDYCKYYIVDKYCYSKVKMIVSGGNDRQDSVFQGLKNVPKETDIVVIHDGVRPFVDISVIEESIENAKIFGACAAAVNVKDTIKVVDNDGFIISTPDRANLYAVQTPQTFRYDLIMKAHLKASLGDKKYTDDTQLIEEMGLKVKLIEGSYSNIKITTSEDLYYGEFIYSKVKEE